MPALLDVLVDPVTLVILGLYGLVLLWEALAPARELPRIALWRTKGAIAFGVYFMIATYLPFAWADALAGTRLADLSGLGTLDGAVVVTLLYGLLAYGWHRAMHRSPFLWRTFHQLHHSAERIDASGAFWMSPLDMAGWTFLFSLASTLVGFTPAAIVAATLFTTLLGIVQHANVRTPRWLGYVVQRPESHSHHHARGVHRGNYADLPIFDLLFGTFVNPDEFAAESGFYDGASSRVGEMLAFRDVSEPLAHEQESGVSGVGEPHPAVGSGARRGSRR